MIFIRCSELCTYDSSATVIDKAWKILNYDLNFSGCSAQLKKISKASRKELYDLVLLPDLRSMPMNCGMLKL